MTFAQRLLFARQTLGITQRELANRLVVSSQTVSNWETGRAEPWNADVILGRLAMWRDHEPHRPSRARVCELLT